MHNVQSSSRSTRPLADMVRGELRRVVGLDPSAIVVTEHHGHVGLIGTVGSWTEREGAVRAARRVPEVRSIMADGLKVRELPGNGSQVCAKGRKRESDQ